MHETDREKPARVRRAGNERQLQSFDLLSRTSALENVALPLIYAAARPALLPPLQQQLRAAASERTERDRIWPNCVS